MYASKSMWNKLERLIEDAEKLSLFPDLISAGFQLATKFSPAVAARRARVYARRSGYKKDAIVYGEAVRALSELRRAFPLVYNNVKSRILASAPR